MEKTKTITTEVNLCATIIPDLFPVQSYCDKISKLEKKIVKKQLCLCMDNIEGRSIPKYHH